MTDTNTPAVKSTAATVDSDLLPYKSLVVTDVTGLETDACISTWVTYTGVRKVRFSLVAHKSQQGDLAHARTSVATYVYPDGQDDSAHPKHAGRPDTPQVN
jgi:hypothetical protein